APAHPRADGARRRREPRGRARARPLAARLVAPRAAASSMTAMTAMTADSGASGLLVNYNGGTGVVRGVGALRRSDFGAPPLVVVDNASHDGSPRVLRERFPDVELIAMAQNVGFAAAVNRGLERLLARPGGPILVLNPDTEVAPDFLAP